MRNQIGSVFFMLVAGYGLVSSQANEVVTAGFSQ